MADVCKGLYTQDTYTSAIPNYDNASLMTGVEGHKAFLANGYRDYTGQYKPAMRRWGSYLRREARRRGLL